MSDNEDGGYDDVGGDYEEDMYIMVKPLILIGTI